jgi:hypothetical protein
MFDLDELSRWDEALKRLDHVPDRQLRDLWRAVMTPPAPKERGAKEAA